MNIEMHLKIVGVMMFLLAAINPPAIKHFNWWNEMKKVDLLARQVFFVHYFFIMFIVITFGVASLLFADALTTPSALAKLLLTCMAMFWGFRLLFQLFAYSPKLWRGNRFRTGMHVLFTSVWSYFTGVYSWALAAQWG